MGAPARSAPDRPHSLARAVGCVPCRSTRFTDVRRFDSIDSTNRYLLDEARAGAPEGVVAVADHQTAGRGRLGRSWEAPPGANLLLSVLLRPDLDPADRHLATTAVALRRRGRRRWHSAWRAGGRTADRIVRSGGRGPSGSSGPTTSSTADGRKLAGVLAEADLAPATRARRRPPAPIVVGSAST